jgi:hypothetical protein
MGQGNSTPAGPLPHQREGILDRLRQIEVRQVQFHPSGLDLREVEDVVDQGEEMLP